jgi:hypothetical protein
LTLEAWINSDDFYNCSSADCRIISKATGVQTQDHYWMLSTINSGASPALRFRLKINDSTETLISNSTVPTSQWVHVAASYDGTTMRVYQDGVEVGTQIKPGSISSNPAVEAWVGDSPSYGTRPWFGAIDDVRIWDVARSQADIVASRNAELTGLETDLLAYYQFNEGSGQLAYDVSGNQAPAVLGSSNAADSNDPTWALVAPDTE